jgi:hypothetical protein
MHRYDREAPGSAQPQDRTAALRLATASRPHRRHSSRSCSWVRDDADVRRHAFRRLDLTMERVGDAACRNGSGFQRFPLLVPSLSW